MHDDWTSNQDYLRLLNRLRNDPEPDRSGLGFMERVNGSDSRRVVTVDADTLSRGGVVPLGRIEHCDFCCGALALAGENNPSCRNCDGAGELFVTKGLTRLTSVCPSCLGTGKQNAVPCPQCQSIANLQHPHMEFQIAPGTENGTEICLPGLGVAGRNGGSNGSLFVRFRLKD